MGWYQLKNIADMHRQWERQYYAQPPTSCPNDGFPLESGQQTQDGGGRLVELHCPMGDYVFRGGRRPI